jgi:uncharacterized radical SAM superfamily protein
MEPATSPENLINLCESLKSNGAKGVLISGGCDAHGGLLNLEKFLPAIKKVHEMALIIKLHTGLVDDKLAKGIVEAGVDIASMEMVGDAQTVKRIFGLNATPKDYLATFERLRSAGVPHICPHVCVGLHDGELKGEIQALNLLAGAIKISTLAIIVLRPTKGTALEHVAPPKGDDERTVVKHARSLFPNTKIILGSLRPRASLEPRLEIELGALDGGVDGIEVPSNDILAEVKLRGLAVKRIEAYGVLPVEYESRVKTEKTN